MFCHSTKVVPCRLFRRMLGTTLVRRSMCLTRPFSQNTVSYTSPRNPYVSHFSSAAPETSKNSADNTATPITMEFKAETLKLLRIVTHSLYTDKEVFVRELISNSADALEKLRFLQSTGQTMDTYQSETPLEIKLMADPKNKTITFWDTGVGMTKDEVINNLGTIAKSGSHEFLESSDLTNNEQAKAIIGQFGVGFYSSFVVSKKVEVFTRSYLPNESGWHWESDGLGTFSIQPCHSLDRGTKIVCYLSDDAAEFSTQTKLTDIAQKFSSFVSFPVSIIDEDGTVKTVITAQEALWVKTKITEEQHTAFFKHISGQSWTNPMYHLLYHSDAPLSIKALLYVPEEAPNRFFSKGQSESGVSLHSRRVLVKKASNDIIPKWLHFIKGVVDCEDIPLNISRENLQDSRIMDMLSLTIVRRFLKFLKDEAQKNPEKFKKFYRQYSHYLKEGFLEDLQGGSKHKDALIQLLRFESTERPSKTSITLDEYVSSCHPSQKNIYYFSACDRQTALASPYLEQFTRRGLNVLLLFEEIDDFVAMHLGTYQDKKLVAIDAGEEEGINADLNLIEPRPSNKENVSLPELSETHQRELEDYIKGILGKRINNLKFSTRLLSSPAVVTGFLPASLRRMMKATMKESNEDMNEKGGSMDLPATLELNPCHSLIHSLYHLKTKSPQVANLIIEQLLDNAKVAARILDEPRSMLSRLDQLLQLTASYAYHDQNTQPLQDTPASTLSKDDDTTCLPKTSEDDCSMKDNLDAINVDTDLLDSVLSKEDSPEISQTNDDVTHHAIDKDQTI